ncbi:LuxR C-terminal-related transcriptional regulator [Cupriavidus sp. 2TAF22]|uniref:LuxR C-terminal-related transcriptional regulator n=1 Tax=unclassified Cupriavidus TaxID=2640874 RepID=UPI003F8EC351
MPETPAKPGPPSPRATLRPVIASKLVPPHIGRKTVPHEPLLARLMAERRRRCFLLQSPAGYGKTTTLVAWGQALTPLGYHVTWLSLDADDNEPSTWVDYLLSSVAIVDPAITRDAMLLEGVGTDQEAIERTVIALVRGIARYRRELVIVLDDLHHITDSRIWEALQWLLDYAPSNLHLAFASRSALPVSLERLRAAGQTLEFGLADLRFSPEEAERFLRVQLGDIEPAAARRLHAQTDGWVAGLQLLSVALKKKRSALSADDLDVTIREYVRDSQTFAAYFEREVLSRMTPGELELLTPAAACDRFCASLCATLTGRDAEGKGGEEGALLERLENDNLFIVSTEQDGAETWYRLHPLLRETLLVRFQSWSTGTRHAIHARAWQWFLGRGHLDEAVQHALKAGEPARAAELAERCAHSLFARGELAKLVALVRLLPPEQVQASVPLRMWMARQHLYHRDFAACAAGIEALQRDLPAQAMADRFTLVALRAVLAVQRDDVEGAMALLPQLLAPPPATDGITLAACNNLLSWIYMQRGEYERARAIQLDAKRPTIDGAALMGTSAGTLQGQCMVGLSHALEGQLLQAERIYRSVLREAEARGRSCNDPACMAASLLGEVLYEQNQNEAARELLESRVDLLERVSIPDSVLRVMIVLSGAHWHAGNRLEAFAYLDRLEEYASGLGLDRLLAYALGVQVQRRLLLGELDAAKACLARLQEVEARRPRSGAERFSGPDFALRGATVRWLLATGDMEQAALILNPLIAHCEAHGRMHNVAALQLQRAVVDAKLGRSAAARANVVSALHLGHRLGLLRRLLDAEPSAMDLVGEIARQETLDPVLTFYVERLQAALPPKPATDNARARKRAASVGVAALSERETDVVRMLPELITTKKIARALGLSPETVKWHLTNIYAKLGVSGRDEALERLRDVDWGTDDDTGG